MFWAGLGEPARHWVRAMQGTRRWEGKISGSGKARHRVLGSVPAASAPSRRRLRVEYSLVEHWWSSTDDQDQLRAAERIRQARPTHAPTFEIHLRMPQQLKFARACPSSSNSPAHAPTALLKVWLYSRSGYTSRMHQVELARLPHLIHSASVASPEHNRLLGALPAVLAATMGTASGIRGYKGHCRRYKRLLGALPGVAGGCWWLQSVFCNFATHFAEKFW
eukprot:349687-Chlamydomonas_euryale.AAC.6